MSLSQLKKRYDEVKKQLEIEGRQAFLEESNDIFKEYPRLESFGWTQYTPYFNDGDECTFGIRSEVFLNGSDPYEDEEVSNLTPTEVDNIRRSVETLITALPSQSMKDIFGDHMSVVVYRSGKIDTEEYSHD